VCGRGHRSDSARASHRLPHRVCESRAVSNNHSALNTLRRRRTRLRRRLSLRLRLRLRLCRLILHRGPSRSSRSIRRGLGCRHASLRLHHLVLPLHAQEILLLLRRHFVPPLFGHRLGHHALCHHFLILHLLLIRHLLPAFLRHLLLRVRAAQRHLLRVLVLLLLCCGHGRPALLRHLLR
jgi:hypothetical protein